jgi:hypothetical protein
MYDFNPRSPYHRRMWHYESDRPLSIAQLVARGSLDPRTAGLLWLLVERHCSVIVSGPTDPTPGVGKTTTLNALLGFLPVCSTLVYTLGMYEDFGFTHEVEPETTCVLANEVSDHLRIYMWGQVARKLLRLPKDGFAVATSCHADTIDDVLAMLRADLRLPAEDVRRVGVIVNIGLVGTLWPPRRRFLSVYFVSPDAPPADADSASAVRAGLQLLPLATWDSVEDTFISPPAETMTRLAGILGFSARGLEAAVERRAACVSELAQGQGVGPSAMRAAVDDLTAREEAHAADTDELAERDDQDEDAAPGTR